MDTSLFDEVSDGLSELRHAIGLTNINDNSAILDRIQELANVVSTLLSVTRDKVSEAASTR